MEKERKRKLAERTDVKGGKEKDRKYGRRELLNEEAIP